MRITGLVVGGGGVVLNGAQLRRTANEGLSEEVRFIRPDPEGQARHQKGEGQGEDARDPGSGPVHRKVR